MRKFLAVLTLFLLSPFIAEFLFGATPLSNIGALVLVIPLYGGGALLIRELVRRRGLDWNSIVLLGIAYAIVEEGLAIQSIFNPNLFNAAAYGARALGINWIWTLWTVTYHVVVSISVPILLAELLFPAIRRQPWTSTAGLIVVGVLYLLGAAGIAAVYRLFVARGYNAPAPLLIAAALLVVVLVIAAIARPKAAVEEEPALVDYTNLAPPIPATGQQGRAPSPWMVGILAFLALSLVFMLLDLPAALKPIPVILVPVLAYILLATAALILLRRWSAPGAGWTRRHDLAIILGVVPVVMLDGFFFVLPNVGAPTDRIVQAAAGLITLALLGVFAARMSINRRAVTQKKLV